MNDRLTNEELRQAIRETWTDTQRCIGADRDAAVLHLNALRVVERNRAWSLLAAAGEQETREPKPGEIDRYYLEQALAAAEARTADLQSKLDEAARLARETAGEAMAFLECKTCAWQGEPGGIYRSDGCSGQVWASAFGFKFCPNCGGEIVNGGE